MVQQVDDGGMRYGVEKKSDLGTPVERWIAELQTYSRVSEKWREDAKRIVDRYALRQDLEPDTYEYDEYTTSMNHAEFNVLWSNVQTIKPTIFARAPMPMVERRHKDPDPLGRLAALTLQRAITADMERDDFAGVFDQVVLDQLLVGRGTPWVRYDPNIVRTEVALTAAEDGELRAPSGERVERERALEREGNWFLPRKELVGEAAVVEFVHWPDFWHKPAKSWESLTRDGWIARREYLTRAQGVRRFGKVFEDVPLTGKREGMSEEMSERYAELLGVAEVFEIWDASEKKVVWLCQDFKRELLDEQKDPLGLEGFFPCPKPAFGTLANDSLIPTPDYRQYMKLADELDEITYRIRLLTSALKIRGIYDEAMENLANLLDDKSNESRMYPVANMDRYIGKGSTGSSIINVVQFLPIDMIAGTLAQLFEAREAAKQTLFEVSGISDIIRGQVDPREKLGQSQLKGQFAGQRLDQRRMAVHRVARDVIERKGEIIAEHFDPQRIRLMSGFDFLPEVERARDEARQALDEARQAAMQDPAAVQALATLPDPRMVVDQMFQAVIGLIRSEKTRGFRIDIETDSTIELNEQQVKEERAEFLTTVGVFLDKTIPMLERVPVLAPALGELMMFVVRGYRAGRTVEAVIEDATRKLEELAANPPPSPEQQKAQAEAARDEKKMQQQARMEQAKMQQQARMEQAKMQLEREKAQAQLELEREKAQMELEIEREKAAMEMREKEMELDTARQKAEIEIETARILADVKVSEARTRVEAAEAMADVKRRNEAAKATTGEGA